MADSRLQEKTGDAPFAAPVMVPRAVAEQLAAALEVIQERTSVRAPLTGASTKAFHTARRALAEYRARFPKPEGGDTYGR